MKLETIYINNQEPWWGNYNPNLPIGDDEFGDGTLKKPFKTLDKAMSVLGNVCENGNLDFGIVRNMDSSLVGFYPP